MANPAHKSKQSQDTDEGHYCILTAEITGARALAVNRDHVREVGHHRRSVIRNHRLLSALGMVTSANVWLALLLFLRRHMLLQSNDNVAGKRAAVLLS
jgi:hypothetical protein